MTEEDKKNKYSRSKVYKLQSNDGYYYIGSTVNSLNQRLGDHKKSSKKENNRRVYKHFNEIGWNNVRIMLISEHNLNNKQELLKEEDNCIKNCKEDEYCLNMIRSSVPFEERKDYIKDCNDKYYDVKKDDILSKMKDYYQNNKEEIKNKVALYRENNKDKVIETNKKYYEKNCEKAKEKAKEYRIKNGYKVKCECGVEIVKYELSRHKKNCKNQNGALNRLSIIVSED